MKNSMSKKLLKPLDFKHTISAKRIADRTFGNGSNQLQKNLVIQDHISSSRYSVSGWLFPFISTGS